MASNQYNMDDKASMGTYAAELTALSEAFLAETSPTVAQLFQRNVKDNMLNLEWEGLSRGVKIPSQTGAPAKARTQVERLRDSWQHLYRDRATRTLSYNDEQFHVLERIKITETGRRLKSLLETECVPPFVKFADILGDWYKIAQTVYVKTMFFKQDALIYQNKLEQFQVALTLSISQFQEDVKAHMEASKNEVTAVSDNFSSKRNNKLKSSLREAEKLTRDIAQIMANDYPSLIDQLNSLYLNKLQSDEAS